MTLTSLISQEQNAPGLFFLTTLSGDKQSWRPHSRANEGGKDKNHNNDGHGRQQYI